MRRDERRARLEMATAIREALAERGVARSGAAAALDLSVGEADAIWIGDVADLPVETLSRAIAKSAAKGFVGFNFVDIAESRAADLVERRRLDLGPDTHTRRLPDDADAGLERWLLCARGGESSRVLIVQPTLSAINCGEIVAQGEVDEGEWLPSWIELTVKRYFEYQLSTMRRVVSEFEAAAAEIKPRIAVGVARHAEEIATIAARYGLHNVRVVGSVARGDETADSDLDLLGDAARGSTLFDMAGAMLAIEELLAVKVQILTDGPHLKPEMRARLIADAIPIGEFAARHARDEEIRKRADLRKPTNGSKK